MELPQIQKNQYSTNEPLLTELSRPSIKGRIPVPYARFGSATVHSAMRVFYLCIPLVMVVISACSTSVTGPDVSSSVALSISGPDSAAVFDSVTFGVKCNTARNKHWDYSWGFGDSTSSLHDSVVTHVYRSAGLPLITVTLTDTSTHATISSAKKQMKIGNLNIPTLSIESADTVRPGDPVTFRLHASVAIRTSWKYRWDFGDRTTLVTDSIASHLYKTEGKYLVTVSLIDTATNFQLTFCTKHIVVFYPPFDLATLQQCKHVTVTAYGPLLSITGRKYRSSPNSGFTFDTTSSDVDSLSCVLTIKWYNSIFAAGSSSSSSHQSFDSIHGTSDAKYDSYQDTVVGTVDDQHTMIQKVYYLHQSSSSEQINGVNGSYWGSCDGTSFQFSGLHFKSQTDSTLSFDAIQPPASTSTYSTTSDSYNGVRSFKDETLLIKKIDWNTALPAPRVVVVFSR